MTHNIKIQLQYADAIIDGRKTFEIRKNDRGYNVGDKVKFDVISYVGELTYYHHPLHPLNNAIYEITYVHSGLGLKKDYVVFGIKEYTPSSKKIVIEIANDDYDRIKSYPDGTTFYPITARLYKAVKDGTPLEEQCDSCIYIPTESEDV